MVRKLVITTVAALALAACNTVRGAAADLNSAADCTENAMNGGNC